MTLAMLFRVLQDKQKVSLQLNDEILWVGIAHNIPIEYFDKLVVNVISFSINTSQTEIRIIVK